jgi:hypothetical protein
MACFGSLPYRWLGTSSSSVPFCTWLLLDGGSGADEAYSIVEPVGGIRAEELEPDRADLSVRVTLGGERLVARWWLVGGGMGLGL